ncbi:MAG: hypothetical protein WC872_01490 [Candidatus Absconditabacterales bacterium]
MKKGKDIINLFKKILNGESSSNIVKESKKNITKTIEKIGQEIIKNEEYYKNKHKEIIRRYPGVLKDNIRVLQENNKEKFLILEFIIKLETKQDIENVDEAIRKYNETEKTNYEYKNIFESGKLFRIFLEFCHENNIDIPMLNRFGTLKEDLEIDKEISRDGKKIKEWIEINKPTKISGKRKA